MKACVKELVENALDAGATRIDLTFVDYGLTAITVADNGKGVPPASYAHLGKRHHTSKLRRFEDLAGVTTLGFRGEALHALCSIADVTLTTCTAEQRPLGRELVFKRGGIDPLALDAPSLPASDGVPLQMVSITPVARDVGVTVTARGLFSTLPVRRAEFRRHVRREYAKCLELIYAYGVLRYDCRFTCTLVTYPGHRGSSNSSHERIPRGLSGGGGGVVAAPAGREKRTTVLATRGGALSQLHASSGVSDGGSDRLASVTGFISKPTPSACGRGSPFAALVYLNGRPIDFPRLSQRLNALYRTFNPARPYPFLVAQLALPAGVWDINVTPDKRHVIFQAEAKLVAWIETVVARLLATPRDATLPPSRSPTPSSATAADVAAAPLDDASPRMAPVAWPPRRPRRHPRASDDDDDAGLGGETEDSPTAATDDLQMTEMEDQPLRRAVKDYRALQQSLADASTEQAEAQLVHHLSQTAFASMHVLGQFNLGFILARHGDHLYIIDQHASDEKHQFEKLRHGTAPDRQVLIQPIRMQLTAEQECLVMAHQPTFNRNGFDVRIDHDAPPGHRTALYSVPQSRAVSLDGSDFEDLLHQIGEHGDYHGIVCKRLLAIYASRACRKAIMIGTPLSQATMVRVVRQLAELRQPWSCPHGRPTVRHLLQIEQPASRASLA
ncbi:hypothetical protein CXG81DRAFT_12836 [Caulochytrium protostelioides]|uniref:MutL C-terminal dimerisation domain-containing protein n=1 Tax=Caulochytrium protostelioides TaxID=1555241 RepID=A0A4P9X6H6_9FUNG|nr:hypothetical protein CXG81DRAFT_12836 [Caulochytrium protostelioides]|eukprot:RKP00784.1 hypothetical protein CXG81DRAFT_12836 [Caulochytrium protostelioides]